MKRITSLILCLVMLGSLLVLPASAASFQVSYYEEAIYAGGVVDLYAFPDNGGVEPYTYQWQFDAAIGDGHWYDLEDNANYTGTKTSHLRMYTSPGNYRDWDQIPFQCVVTDAEGTVCYTPDIYMVIYPTDELIPDLKAWGYGLYEPTITNVTGFQTNDYGNYTASTSAGSKLTIFCGSKSAEEKAILRNSEVKLTRQIHITENGHTTKVGDQVTYVPHTVGANAVTVEILLQLTIGEYDLGELDRKTIKLSTSKPAVASTAATKSDCSLLRYTYNESQKLASIPKGSTVEVLAKEGSYYQVFYNNFVGYVGTSLLDVQSSYDPVIKHVDVTIAEPVAGESPSFTCDVLTAGCRLYKTEPVSWYDKTAKRFLTAADKFQEGRSYDLTIWLAAKAGYIFRVDASDKPDLTGTINGNLPPFINKAYEQDPKEVIELTYTFNNVKEAPEQTHTCVPVLVEPVEPTCTEDGREAYYRCGCGMHYKDAAGTQIVDSSTWGVIPATGHAVSDWRITQIYHYRACTVCGDLLEQEDHRGGKATCLEKGMCDICGHAYLPETETHTPDEEWTACAGLYHAYLCKLCGAHCDPEAHQPGPAATETEAQTCTVCGYILAPAKNHTHELIKVPQTPADCVNEGNIAYYFCVGCNACFTDAEGKNKIPETMSVAVGALGHIASEAWTYDTHCHWRTCSVCSAVLDETRMLHEAADGKCITCGYAAASGGPVQEAAPNSTKPAQPGKETMPSTDAASGTEVPSGDVPNGRSPLSGMKDVGWAMVVMIGLVCFGASITASVIILKRKKK